MVQPGPDIKGDPISKLTNTKGLVEWLKWKNTYLANTKP
jgi:hypothetical protein